MSRPVTEQDFRLPEFRDAKPEDYEFRGDGKVVRKDRWETGIRSICSLVGHNVREFEIPEIVDAVRHLAKDSQGWEIIASEGDPESDCVVDVRLIDGTRLHRVNYKADNHTYTWRNNDNEIVLVFVVAWRES